MIDMLARRLRAQTRGEVLSDAPSRGRYATDASIYQIMPVGVFVPTDAADVRLAIDICRDDAERPLGLVGAAEGIGLERRHVAEADRKQVLDLPGGVPHDELAGVDPSGHEQESTGVLADELAEQLDPRRVELGRIRINHDDDIIFE